MKSLKGKIYPLTYLNTSTATFCAGFLTSAKRTRGYIAFYTVLILLAFSIATAGTVALLSLGEAQSAFALFKGEEALSLVEGCTEDALLRSSMNASYNGGVIARPEGSCTVGVTNAGVKQTITITNTSPQYKRTIQVVINRTSTGVTLTSWKEI